MSASLGAALEALYQQADFGARAARDPVRFPRRYTLPEDRELAGLLASGLAYGRVDLFLPVLERLFAHLDARGGPARCVQTLDPRVDGPALEGLVYRWTRGVDVLLLLGALHALGRRGGSLRELFEGGWTGRMDTTLDRGVLTLRELAVEAAAEWGMGTRGFDTLPRGLRNFLPRPADGSACKRWNMLLRWLVRPPREGVDLGLWTRIPTSALILPLDVHTARFGRWLGLLDRRSDDWAAAAQLTAGLARIDPQDPVRFDFALAHLGISGACAGGRSPLCLRCPLQGSCAAPERPSGSVTQD